MDFAALDVETANSDLSSICQIGIVVFENGEIARSWQAYVDPEDYFDGVNVSIHGITAASVEGAPTFPALVGEIGKLVEGRVVVCHTGFDRVALDNACAKPR